MRDRRLKLAVLADAAHVNCQRWCEGLHAAGAEVHMISFASAELKNISVHRVPKQSFPGKLRYFTGVPYVRKLFASLRPDVVVAYYVTGYGTLATLVGYHPIVQVTSGSDVLVAPNSRMMNRLLRSTLSRADLVTAWAPHMAEAALALGVTQQRLFVLPRGIPFETFANYTAPPPNERDSASIISTRSLYPNYRIDLLLKAAHLLYQRNVDFSLTICGDGPCRNQITAEAQRLGVFESRVKVVGFVSNDALAGVLGRHNLYVSLIEYDGVSASLLEAMAVGLLPIVPDHRANRDWIKDGENGLLLKDVTAETIAQAIVRAIQDKDLRNAAWAQNPGIVRERADLHRNARQYYFAFKNLATGLVA